MNATAEPLDLVGPYRLLKAIGAGGSARIDLARIDRAYNFQRHVVIKRPLEHLRDDSRAAASLRREARIGGLLRHPNLIAVLDAGNHHGYDYLVLEYVHGASLRTLMQLETPGRVRATPLGVALALVGDVARGLHVAHELVDEHGAPLGLVHRDVSPSNILVGFDGSVKLADFGIAKETRVTTLSGSMHGTVTYMAPEQCRGHAFDRRADVFSLGVILYELTTATRLFWADNDVASLHRVLSGTVPRPRKVNSQIPAALEDAIMTALAQDPDRRFPSTRALADALEQIAAALGVVLGARWIARWVEEVLGPRDVPWIESRDSLPASSAAEGRRGSIGATTIPDAPRGDGSLVELIAAAPDAADDHVSVDFGPSDPQDDTQRDRRDPAPTRRSRRPLVIAMGALATAAVAAVTVAVVANRPRDVVTRAPLAEPAAPPPPAAPAAAPPAAQAGAPAPITPAAEPATAAADPAVAEEPEPQTATPEPANPKSTKRVTRGKRGTPRPEPVAPVIETASTPPTTTAARPTAGSGATKSGPSQDKPQWDPTLLLPSDSGSGTRKQ